jgi:Holliday junction resolvase RusA-like endonuclease
MIRFRVHGDPVPQGSMRHIGHGRIVHDKGAGLRRWRAAIENAAHHAMRNRRLVDGACAIECEFVLPRPESRKRAAHADRKPDLDKLARAVGDALEKVVYTQDSRVVGWVLRKRYAGAEEPSGVVVIVEAASPLQEANR